MQQWMLLVSVLLWIYILYVTRPGEIEFREQLAAGGTQPWPIEVMEAVMSTSPLGKLPGSMKSSRIHDYGIITVIWDASVKNPDLVLVGLLCRFMPIEKSFVYRFLNWNEDSDILLAIGLHALSLFLYWTFPRFAARMFQVSLWRPYTWFLGSFNTRSVWRLIIDMTMLLGVGTSVRKSLPRSQYPSVMFFVLYCLIPSLATLLNRQLIDGMASTMGGSGGILALTTYGVLSIPNHRFSLFGQFKLGCFAICILEISQVIALSPLRHPVSLLLDAFLVCLGAIFTYRLQHPRETFDLDKIARLTVQSLYAF